MEPLQTSSETLEGKKYSKDVEEKGVTDAKTRSRGLSEAKMMLHAEFLKSRPEYLRMMSPQLEGCSMKDKKWGRIHLTKL